MKTNTAMFRGSLLAAIVPLVLLGGCDLGINVDGELPTDEAETEAGEDEGLDDEGEDEGKDDKGEDEGEDEGDDYGEDEGEDEGDDEGDDEGESEGNDDGYGEGSECEAAVEACIGGGQLDLAACEAAVEVCLDELGEWVDHDGAGSCEEALLCCIQDGEDPVSCGELYVGCAGVDLPGEGPGPDDEPGDEEPE
ncbi:MAG: hypothetical protein AAF799_02030 [Myxococcota bacterium]